MATLEELALLHNIILGWRRSWDELNVEPRVFSVALKRFPATDIFLFRPSRVITGSSAEVYEVEAGYYGGPAAVKDEVRTSLTLHCQHRTKQSSAPAKRVGNTDGTSAFITSHKSAGSQKTPNCNPAELQCNNCKYYVIRALIFIFY